MTIHSISVKFLANKRSLPPHLDIAQRRSTEFLHHQGDTTVPNSVLRKLVLHSATALACAAVAGQAAASQFPDKDRPIRLIVPFTEGSSFDAGARAYAQAMAEDLGANVIVENRPGADGVIGVSAAKNAAPDGYTVLFTSLSTQVVNPHIFKKLAYDPINDFIPLVGTMKTTLVMAVGPSFPQGTAADFLESAKKNPGKHTYASYTATTKMAGQMVAKAAGADYLNIPYKSLNDAMSNMMGGLVDMIAADMPSIQPFFSKGVRPLAVLAPQRLAAYPDIPTLAEFGYSEVDIAGWFAAYVPKNTPAEVADVLTQSIRKAAQSKYVKDFVTTFGIETFPLEGDELAAYQKSELEKWGKAVKEAGLQGTL